MAAGALVKGWSNKNLTTYVDGYALGTDKEPPYAYLVLTGDITFGGFSSSYSVGTEGLLIFVQDATGGRTIDWDGHITFVGGSGINLAANTVTAVDVIKTPLGWMGFLRDIPQGTFVNQINGMTGNVTLVAEDVDITDAAGYFVATTIEGALTELYEDMQELSTPPRDVVTSTITSFDLLQTHSGKIIRMTNATAATVNLSRTNFNPATITKFEVLVTNRGSSVATLTPDGSVSLSYVDPGVSLTINPGQTLLVRYTSDNGSIMSFDVEGYQQGTSTGLSLLAAASQSAARTAIGLDTLTQPLISLPGKNFDGSTMYLSVAGSSMGIVDSKVGTLFLALRFANAASGTETLINNPRFSVVRNSSGNIVVTGKNSSNTTIMSFATATAPCATSGYYTILITWDLATASTGQLYVNDVSDYAETTYTNDTLDYDNGSWYVGADTSAANKFTGDIFVLWFDPTARTALTTANRRKFVDVNNVPQFLGRTGQLPTGSTVGLFHAYSAVPSWKTNRGSFSFTWTENGTPTASTGLLRGQYAEFGISTYAESVLDDTTESAMRTTLGLSVLTSPLMSFGGAAFNGSTNYLDGNALTGIVDAKTGSLYMVVRFANAASATETLIGSTSDKFLVVRTSTGNIQITAKNAANSSIMSFATTGTPCSAAGTYVIMSSWDLATAGTGRLYINDTSNFTQTTYTNDTIDYTTTEWSVGGSDSGTNKFTGDMYVLWFDATARLEFNTTSVRRAFTDPNGVPYFLGKQGELPRSGTVPQIFHAYDDFTLWHVPRGSLNTTSWTQNGTFAAAGTALAGQQRTDTSLGQLRLKSISAAYTMILADAGLCLYHPSADTTARAWTIPANSSVPFPIGTVITIDNDSGAGALTISITTDTLSWVGSSSTGTRTLATSGQATLMKVTATRWRISGVGLT